jgi:hypothetical protein
MLSVHVDVVRDPSREAVPMHCPFDTQPFWYFVVYVLVMFWLPGFR